MTEQLRLFDPGVAVRCEIFKRTFGETTWYMVDVSFDGTNVYTNFFDSLEGAKADSERIKRTVGA